MIPLAEARGTSTQAILFFIMHSQRYRLSAVFRLAFLNLSLAKGSKALMLFWKVYKVSYYKLN